MNSFAIGEMAMAYKDNQIGVRNSQWIVEDNNFKLLVGDANMTTILSENEAIVLRNILERMHLQMRKQENRL